MMKKIFTLALAALFCNANSQTIFSENFSALTLQTFTSTNVSVQYTNVPTGFALISDGYNNNSSSNNAPFNVPALKPLGWAVAYNAIENDTFLVSSSWLDVTATSDRWIITPPISNIQANTVLTWLAKSPDAAFPDGYEVYGTNKTGTLSAVDFTAGDKLLTVSSENSNWTRRSINLGNFAGQTLRFAFRNNSSNKFQLWIDDIAVTTLSNSVDAALTSIKANKYFLTGLNQTVRIKIQNNGASALTSVTANYIYGTSSTVSQTFTFTSLQAFEHAQLNLPQPFSITSPGLYPLKVWLSSPNGVGDQYLLNDTITMNITAQTASPQRVVMVEQFVSATDGESVDAQEKLKALESSSVVVVNIHGNDSLKKGFGPLLTTLYKKKYSTAMVNRTADDSLNVLAIGRTYYANRIKSALGAVTPASVSVVNKTFNTGTRELSFAIKADFVGDVKGDYRLNAFLIERNVHGPTQDTTVNGYNQLSNYFNVPWSPYYQNGYYSAANNAWVLNAAQFKHHNVLVATLNGASGNSGTIPQTGGTAGQSYQETFSVTVPTSTTGASIYNADNLYIVAFLVDYSNDNILNAAMDKLTVGSEVVSVHEKSGGTQLLEMYPNPASNQVYLKTPYKGEMKIKILDLSGRTIKEEKLNTKYTAAILSCETLAEGIYLIEVQCGDTYFTSKLIKRD